MFKKYFFGAFLFLILGVIASVSSAEVMFFGEFRALDPFQPANQLEITVRAWVEPSTQTDYFTYYYKLTSNKESKQDMYSFKLIVKDSAVENSGSLRDDDISSPLGWDGRVSEGATAWIGLYGKRINLISWFNTTSINPEDPRYPPAHPLKPGSTSEGFSFKSKGLPTIEDFWARGWVRAPSEWEIIERVNEKFGTDFPNHPSGMPPNEMILAVWPGFRYIYENAFSSKTLSAKLPPETFEPLSFLDNLISLKEQAYSLGWIDNKGILNSLDQKLEAAKKNIEKGKVNTAKNILGAFINEVEAQKEKHLSSEAYALLKFNAQYLIENL